MNYTAHQIRFLDKLAGDWVRGRAICQKCHQSRDVQWAHIQRRWAMNTRWDRDNALALCQSCHDDVDSDPAVMRAVVEDVYGTGHYEALDKRAHEYPTRPYEEIRESLTGR